MAEEVGFEPTVRSHARWFSRPVHSTTLPLLRSKHRIEGCQRFCKPGNDARCVTGEQGTGSPCGAGSGRVGKFADAVLSAFPKPLYPR